MTKCSSLALLLAAGLFHHTALAEDRCSKEENPAAFDRLLQNAVTEGGLPSVSAAVITADGTVYLRSYGFADKERQIQASPEKTLYSVASISKVMTATLLGALSERGIVALDEEAETYLPPGVSLPSDTLGQKPTLRHLATHGAALPHDPIKLDGRWENPFEGYTCAKLHEGLAEIRLGADVGLTYHYSNLGFGLLGDILIRSHGSESFDALLRERLLTPLGMTRTSAPAAPPEGMAVGYQNGRPTPYWDLGCLAGAGAVTSSAADMARFVHLYLRYAPHATEPLKASTLRSLYQAERNIVPERLGIGLGWHITRNGEIGDFAWHNGMTQGFASMAAFSHDHRTGIVVLTNSASSVDAVGVELLREAVRQYGACVPEPTNLLAPPERTVEEAPLAPELRALAERIPTLFGIPSPESLAEVFDPFVLDFMNGVGLHRFLAVAAESYQDCVLASLDGSGVFAGRAVYQCAETKLALYLALNGHAQRPRLMYLAPSPL